MSPEEFRINMLRLRMRAKSTPRATHRIQDAFTQLRQIADDLHERAAEGAEAHRETAGQP
jgi:hypothetical protein